MRPTRMPAFLEEGVGLPEHGLTPACYQEGRPVFFTLSKSVRQLALNLEIFTFSIIEM